MTLAIASAAGLFASPAALTAPSEAVTNGAMVAFGDSVPSGGACSCRPFPQRYAHMVSKHTGRSVHMTNDAFAGARSGSVVKQLADPDVRHAVEASRTVLVMVGANDFERAFRRVLAHEVPARIAFPPVAARVRKNLTTIVRRLKAVRPGIRVMVAGYWNVMKDGKVGLRTYGPWGMRKANQATTFANAALRKAVAATHAIYVSTYRPFKGAGGRLDPTPLLTADGDHPNAKGHAVIARAFSRAAPNG